MVFKRVLSYLKAIFLTQMGGAVLWGDLSPQSQVVGNFSCPQPTP